MLIHLTGQVVKNQIEFDLVNLPLHQNSSVSAVQLSIQYDELVQNVCGSIQTTLIERSGLNPLQELLSFGHTGPVKHFLYTPTRLLWYKVQLVDLKTSVFKITHSEPEQTKKISKINLKLLIHEGLFEINP